MPNNTNTVNRNRMLQAAMRRQEMYSPPRNTKNLPLALQGIFRDQYSTNAALAMAAAKKRELARKANAAKRKRNNNAQMEQERRRKLNENRRRQAEAEARFQAMNRISRAIRAAEAADRRARGK